MPKLLLIVEFPLTQPTVGGPAVPNLFLPDRAIWRAYNGNPYVKSRLRVCRLSRAVGVWLWCPKALVGIPWVRPGWTFSHLSRYMSKLWRIDSDSLPIHLNTRIRVISELSGYDSEGYRTKVRNFHTPQAQVSYENIFGHHRPLPDSLLSWQIQNPDLKSPDWVLNRIAAPAAGEIPIFLPGQGGWSPASGRVLDYLYRCNAFGLAR